MTSGDELFELATEEEERGELAEAFGHLLTASQLGHLESQIVLANFYAEGKGTSRDMSAAERWYEIAYSRGSREAAYNLGIEFRNSGDLIRASGWLKKAVDLNDGDACVALAELSLDSEERAALSRCALALSPDDITQDAREAAERILADANT